jgi:hypothetical protein
MPKVEGRLPLVAESSPKAWPRGCLFFLWNTQCLGFLEFLEIRVGMLAIGLGPMAETISPTLDLGCVGICDVLRILKDDSPDIGGDSECYIHSQSEYSQGGGYGIVLCHSLRLLKGSPHLSPGASK